MAAATRGNKLASIKCVRRSGPACCDRRGLQKVPGLGCATGWVVPYRFSSARTCASVHVGRCLLLVATVLPPVLPPCWIFVPSVRNLFVCLPCSVRHCAVIKDLVQIYTYTRFFFLYLSTSTRHTHAGAPAAASQVPRNQQQLHRIGRVATNNLQRKTAPHKAATTRCNRHDACASTSPSHPCGTWG